MMEGSWNSEKQQQRPPCLCFLFFVCWVETLEKVNSDMEAKGVRFLAYQSIFSSVGSGDFDGVKKLVEEVKKEEGSSLSDVMSLQNDAGETALYIAAENNLQEMFSFLLSICHFEVVKIRSKADMNAFHVAAKRGNLGSFFLFFFLFFME